MPRSISPSSLNSPLVEKLFGIALSLAVLVCPVPAILRTGPHAALAGRPPESRGRLRAIPATLRFAPVAGEASATRAPKTCPCVRGPGP